MLFIQLNQAFYQISLFHIYLYIKFFDGTSFLITILRKCLHCNLQKNISWFLSRHQIYLDYQSEINPP